LKWFIEQAGGTLLRGERTPCGLSAQALPFLMKMQQPARASGTVMYSVILFCKATVFPRFRMKRGKWQQKNLFEHHYRTNSGIL
jgi:hypothetical protein